MTETFVGVPLESLDRHNRALLAIQLGGISPNPYDVDRLRAYVTEQLWGRTPPTPEEFASLNRIARMNIQGRGISQVEIWYLGGHPWDQWAQLYEAWGDLAGAVRRVAGAEEVIGGLDVVGGHLEDYLAAGELVPAAALLIYAWGKFAAHVVPELARFLPRSS